MRGRAIGEGGEEEAETPLRLLGRNAQALEEPGLHLRVVDTDGTAAHLVAVQDAVVGAGQGLARVALHQVALLQHGGCEGMMHRHPAFLLVAPLKEREARHPQEAPGVRPFPLIEEATGLAQLQAQHAQDSAGLCAGGVGQKEQRVTLLQLRQLPQLLQLLSGEELHQRALQIAIFAQEVRQAGGAELLGPGLKVHELLAGEGRPAGQPKGPHNTARLQHLAEGLEGGRREHGSHVAELKGDAQIGLVAAEAVHRLPVWHPLEGRRDIHVQNLLE